MAYTNSPELQSYKTVKLDFTATPFYRMGDLSVQRDANMINLFFDRVSNENQERAYVLKKRAGIGQSTYSLTKTSASNTIVGYFYAPDDGYIYWALSDKKVYSLKLSDGTVTNINTFTNTPTQVGFCAFLKSNGTRYLMMTDGIELYYHTFGTGVSTKVTDADLPSPHQPYPVYLDGYLFLVKSNTGDIYNSNLDDPSAWTAGDFITSEISADYINVLHKMKNYIVAFGNSTIEFFYDGANLSGSPLTRNESYVHYISYIGGLVTIGDRAFFIAHAVGQGARVYQMLGDQIAPISNPVVERTIQSLGTSQSSVGITANSLGHSISIDGHDFYIMNTSQNTWIYDIDTKLWSEWRTSNDTAAGLVIEAIWNIDRATVLMGISNLSYVSYMSTSLYQDFGSNFTCTYTTEDFTADTPNWKTCHRVYVVADMHQQGTSNATLSWSDNDWNDGGVTARNVNIFSSSPYITQTGRFRNRSWRLKYADNYPFRCKGLIMDLNVGNT